MKLATVGGTVVVALPGNPLAAVSALITLAWPLLDAASGRLVEPRPGSRVAALAAQVDRSPTAHRLIPGRRDRAGVVTPALRRGPAMLSGLASADCMVVIAPGPQPLDAGDEVEVIELPW
jgi:molybdopterin molybdotransferase